MAFQPNKNRGTCGGWVGNLTTGSNLRGTIDSRADNGNTPGRSEQGDLFDGLALFRAHCELCDGSNVWLTTTTCDEVSEWDQGRGSSTGMHHELTRAPFRTRTSSGDLWAARKCGSGMELQQHVSKQRNMITGKGDIRQRMEYGKRYPEEEEKHICSDARSTWDMESYLDRL